MAAWSDDYNTDRRHSALGPLAPITFEQTGIPIQHDRAVLAGVKAEPFGWQCRVVRAFGGASNTAGRTRVAVAAWRRWNAAEPL